MNTIKFTSKTTCLVNGIEYKGYTVGELPNSFGFIRKHNSYDEDGKDLYKYGKKYWFNYKGLTWMEKPPTW